jgi:hypothetical protein
MKIITETLEKKRKFQLDAVLVRIMESHKQMTFADIVDEV